MAAFCIPVCRNHAQTRLARCHPVSVPRRPFRTRGRFPCCCNQSQTTCDVTSAAHRLTCHPESQTLGRGFRRVVHRLKAGVSLVPRRLPFDRVGNTAIHARSAARRSFLSTPASAEESKWQACRMHPGCCARRHIGIRRGPLSPHWNEPPDANSNSPRRRQLVIDPCSQLL